MINKKIYLLNTPEHGNLGDHAITIAEKKFLYDFFPQFEVIEIVGTDPALFSKLQSVAIGDLIFLHGGGYLGDLWPWEDERCKRIIAQLPQNKIFYFPQTYFFEHEATREEKIETDREFYQCYPNVEFFLREAASYKMVQNSICVGQNNVRKYPDMALYLNKNENNLRAGILICLRSDKERIGERKWLDSVIAYAVQQNKEIKYTDTIEGDYLNVSERDIAVEKKLKEFASAELVITDRLHGMIFAVLAGIPCIAFDNISGKISGVYQWIKNLDSVICISEQEFTLDCMELMHKTQRYDARLLNDYFKDMAYHIQSAMNKNKCIIYGAIVDSNKINYRYKIEGDWKKYFSHTEACFLNTTKTVTGISEEMAMLPLIYIILPLAWLCGAEICLSKLDKKIISHIDYLFEECKKQFPSLPFLGCKLFCVKYGLADSMKIDHHASGCLESSEICIDSFFSTVFLKEEILNLLGDNFYNWKLFCNQVAMSACYCMFPEEK